MFVGLSGRLMVVRRCRFGLAQWLWRVIDVRGTQETIERLGILADGAGHALEEIEPRTLQHHLGIVVCGLLLAIGLLYWLVL